MKKLSLFLAVVLLVASPSASAAGTVKYVKQKAGQFCKALEIGKYVVTPSGKLKCTVAEGIPRARWSHS
jgi:hypothetical protein